MLLLEKVSHLTFYVLIFIFVAIFCAEMWFPALLDIPLQCISVLINRKIPLITESMSGSDEVKNFSIFERLIFSLLFFLFVVIVLAAIALFVYGIFMVNDHFERKRKEKKDATYKLVLHLDINVRRYYSSVVTDL